MPGKDLKPHAFRAPGVQVRFDKAKDILGPLIGNEPESELGKGFPGEHRLCAFTLISAAHAIDLCGGPRADPLNSCEAWFTRKFRHACEGANVGIGDWQRDRRLTLPIEHGTHVGVEALNGDPAIFVVQARNKPRSCSRRIHDSSAKNPGMQVLCGTVHVEFQGSNAAQGKGEGGVPMRRHARVGNHDHIAVKVCPVFLKKGRQVITAYPSSPSTRKRRFTGSAPLAARSSPIPRM